MTLIIKPLNYSLCKKLASKRFAEAKLLKKGELNSGAYYLGGYVIEFALKACYCQKVKKGEFPPERSIYDKLYDHDLNKLLDVSGIKPDFYKEVKTNDDLQSAWDLIKDWSEKTRYAVFTRNDAESLIKSMEIVFDWIKTKW